MLARNPMDRVQAPRATTKTVGYIEADDVRRLLDAAKGTLWHPILFLAINTGMRRSELLALRWCDLDLDLLELRVERSMHRLRDGRVVFGLGGPLV